ncbi:MAG: chromosome segregation protein SMC [Methylobacterium sp.]|nr:chromosome segregation protein SMC [Methylobacterium sp.]
MRLTHLKLAGFKSFVDPTTLHIHGQRVGVVGPNGCGKSNVMEAVRWVLGESSAKEMRGDSMQDVIFNGASNRKPVSRASVELLFDNSLGSAAGEWAQYAEISVRRVLQRDSGSAYYINNTQVRRRDVADLFLGTGLGGRAYAIIGQNTISRIVEARPEELRVFLEEAAGVSKYKERRRETELRLRDTRDNLTRVEDIRRELDHQIARLESQAEVAQQYQALQQQLGIAQAQVWLLKKRDAAQSWEKARRQVERLANELEAQTASLRNAESALEKLRQQYHSGSDAVHAAQAAFYEANARVSTLEQQVRHAQDNLELVRSQLQQIDAESARAEASLEQQRQQLQQSQEALAQAAGEAGEARQRLESCRQSLPAAEQALRDAQAEFSQIQNAILQAEQQAQLETSHLNHGHQSLTALEARQHRLTAEQNQLHVPDGALLAGKEAEAGTLLQTLAATENTLSALTAQEQAANAQWKADQQGLQDATRRLAQSEAQIAALARLQDALGQEGKLQSWLEHRHLAGGRRLWQLLKVEAGCETALEGALGVRLNALVSDQSLDGDDRPPAALVLGRSGSTTGQPSTHPAGWRPLLAYLAGSSKEIGGVLDDWLRDVWLLPDDQRLEAASAGLRPGELLVNRHGDVASRHSLYLHAPQSALHGVLERQRELTALQGELPQVRQHQQAMQSALQEAEQQLQQLRHAISDCQHRQRQQTTAAHAARMELQRLQQQQLHALERQRRLHEEAASLGQQKTVLESEIAGCVQKISACQAQGAALRTQRDAAGNARQEAETSLRQRREALIEAERAAQKEAFSEKLIANNINEIQQRINSLLEDIAAMNSRRETTRQQVGPDTMEQLKSAMEQALALQRSYETALAQARDAQSGIEQQLQSLEQRRMQTEQQLHPARDRLEQARLGEQQARLHFEYCAVQLNDCGIEEAGLEAMLDKNARGSTLEETVAALQAGIAELGAVNLAAIAELASERERKNYLDSQAMDLEEAVATLEEAIRRIDRETRSKLQNTFDEANRHFAELFATLFGGGHARLEMLGDEILDTGMQVFAQPPGKKNSTIHLLSGGEKALTALALVFALFRLNPAPFCLMDEVDAPLDDSNTERFCALVRKMSERTQFLFVSHNKITMEMAQQLVGVTMQESGVSRIVEVDIEAAVQMQTELAL